MGSLPPCHTLLERSVLPHGPAGRARVYCDIGLRDDRSPKKAHTFADCWIPKHKPVLQFHDEHDTPLPGLPPCCSARLAIKGKMTFQNNIPKVVGVQVGGLKRSGEQR